MDVEVAGTTLVVSAVGAKSAAEAEAVEDTV